MFPAASAGLVSTIDDFFRFTRMVRAGGEDILSTAAVNTMTSNQLSPEQIKSAGALLGGSGWGYAMAVVVNPTEDGRRPGQYGWSGGYGLDWFTDPDRDLIALVFSQTSDFMFNGGMAEFCTLATRAAD